MLMDVLLSGAVLSGKDHRRFEGRKSTSSGES